ncbi:hypothetical protein [Streptomyces sp. NPDC048521]|uniref:Pepco domain-containing protein n=1 Tax=Streptomyces sp. NPDC048521 TaxID=3365566 RepID=UPI0037142055
MFETAKAAHTEPDDTVPSVDVLVSIDGGSPTGTGDMGIFGRNGGDASLRQIPVTVLRDNLQRTVDALQEVLGSLQVPDTGMPLRQAQVSFEITATGGIALVGTSAQVGAKGAITLTFGA